MARSGLGRVRFCAASATGSRLEVALEVASVVPVVVVLEVVLEVALG